MMHLVQLQKGVRRCVALVDEPHLRPLSGTDSLYALAVEAAASGASLTALVRSRVSADELDYDSIYDGTSTWRLLAPIDHPTEPARCLVSGTGLTHLGSAGARDVMHAGGFAPLGIGSGRPEHGRRAGAKPPEELTDSMKMFRAGVEGGRPPAGRIGSAPEWFYKGSGTILRAHGEPLEVPSHASDGGEEAEIAGVYVIDEAGRPRRIGMTVGNEFADHEFEKTNYLNLAASKLRTCAIGPELAIEADFRSVRGHVAIERHGKTIWQKDITTGEHEMCHSLANLEHHHFKFESHRRPGDVHVHYFGAHSLSFGDGVKLLNDDVMVIGFEGFGRPLRNRVLVALPSSEPIAVRPLL